MQLHWLLEASLNKASKWAVECACLHVYREVCVLLFVLVLVCIRIYVVLFHNTLLYIHMFIGWSRSTCTLSVLEDSNSSTYLGKFQCVWRSLCSQPKVRLQYCLKPKCCNLSLMFSRLVHAFTCAGMLPAQYLKFGQLSKIGCAGKWYIRRSECKLIPSPSCVVCCYITQKDKA